MGFVNVKKEEVYDKLTNFLKYQRRYIQQLFDEHHAIKSKFWWFLYRTKLKDINCQIDYVSTDIELIEDLQQVLDLKGDCFMTVGSYCRLKNLSGIIKDALDEDISDT
jgi:hypothetical protein